MESEELKNMYDYDPYTQLSALELVISTLREQSAGNTAGIAVGKVSGKYQNSGTRGDDEYVNDMATAEFFDAFLSSTVAACLAQFIEGALRYEVIRLRFKNSSKIPTSSAPRVKNLSEDQFWDVSCYYNKSKKREETNLVLGACQIFDVLGFKNLPENFKQELELLYTYRNYVMHNGVEWPCQLREKFQKLEENYPSGRFQWSTSDNRPWIAHLSLNYIDELLKFCRSLRDCFE